MDPYKWMEPERPQHHMHWNLIDGTTRWDGTLKVAPNWGPLLMVQSDEKCLTKVYSKSLLKGIKEIIIYL